MINDKYYLNIGRASDLKGSKDYFIYRALEILPGALIWLTFLGMIIFSIFWPKIAAYFIIIFSAYWIFRTLHFSIHLVSAYMKMKKNLKTDWVKKLDKLAENSPAKNWREVYQLIVFPTYKENLEVIRESFRALINSRYPKEKMIVVLAIEERAGEFAKHTSQAILQEFGDKFFKFLITCHPKNLVGEIAGKGSNTSWAGREVKEKIIDPLQIPYEKIIVSCFDADTQVFPDYFSCLSYYYLISPNPGQTSFQPIPLYLNNLWEAKFFSRLVASCNVFWEMMQQQRPEKIITYSSHSMSFKALAAIDFWQKNVVSEDAGIFWKAFLFYDGNYKIIPLHYPVSMDCVVGKTLKETIISQYKQQRRWAWGSEGIPYLLFGFSKNKKILFQKKFRYSFLIIESFWTWGTTAFLLLLLGRLPLLLGGSQFKNTVLAYTLPNITSNLMTLAMIGLIVCIIISTLLLTPRPKNYPRWKSLSMIAQWFFFPLAFIFFGALPSVEAQTRLMLGKYLGFYTIEKTRDLKG
jgi:hypothetical protein